MNVMKSEKIHHDNQNIKKSADIISLEDRILNNDEPTEITKTLMQILMQDFMNKMYDDETPYSVNIKQQW